MADVRITVTAHPLETVYKFTPDPGVIHEQLVKEFGEFGAMVIERTTAELAPRVVAEFEYEVLGHHGPHGEGS